MALFVPSQVYSLDDQVTEYSEDYTKIITYKCLVPTYQDSVLKPYTYTIYRVKTDNWEALSSIANPNYQILPLISYGDDFLVYNSIRRKIIIDSVGTFV